MTDPWVGPAAIAAGLLVVAGAAKVRKPDELSISAGVVRVGAIFEGGLGVVALALGREVHFAVGLSYLGFAVFVAWAMTRSVPLRSCGCFGEPDTPPTITHLAINLGLAVAALGAGTTGAPGIGAASTQPLAGVPLLLLIALGTSSAALALSWLPRIAGLRGLRAEH